MTRLMFCRGKFLSVRTELALLRGAGKLLRYVRYRGIGTLSKILGHIFDSDNSAVIKIGDNSSVNVYLGDYYWSRLIYDDYEYEPDIGFVLGQIVKRLIPMLPVQSTFCRLRV
jgi:hypothetical protein